MRWGCTRPRAAGEQQGAKAGRGAVGAPGGPSAAGAVCPPPPVAPRTRLLSQLLLNPPLQLLAAGPAAAPLSQGGRAAQVQGQGPHLLEGAGARLRGPPQGQGCQHGLPTGPRSCQPSRTFVHPFVRLPGRGGGDAERKSEVRCHSRMLPSGSACPFFADGFPVPSPLSVL